MEAKTIPTPALETSNEITLRTFDPVDTEALIYRVAAMLQYTGHEEVRNRLLDEGVGRDTVFFAIQAAIILNDDLEGYLAN